MTSTVMNFFTQGKKEILRFYNFRQEQVYLFKASYYIYILCHVLCDILFYLMIFDKTPYTKYFDENKWVNIEVLDA